MQSAVRAAARGVHARLRQAMPRGRMRALRRAGRQRVPLRALHGQRAVRRTADGALQGTFRAHRVQQVPWGLVVVLRLQRSRGTHVWCGVWPGVVTWMAEYLLAYCAVIPILIICRLGMQVSLSALLASVHSLHGLWLKTNASTVCKVASSQSSTSGGCCTGTAQQMLVCCLTAC